MKKKMTIILVSAFSVILIAALSWAAVGIVQKQKAENESALYYTDKTIADEKIHTTADGKNVGLRYKRSLERADGTALHIYEDSGGNEYFFDASGELIGRDSEKQEENTTANSTIAQNDTPTSSPQEEIGTTRADQPAAGSQPSAYLSTDAPATEEEKALIAIARQYAIETYGEEYFSKFSYSQMIDQPAMKQHRIVFSITYKERFSTESCIVTLTDGVPQRITTLSKGEDEGFDPALLDKIEIETLEKFVEAEVAKEYLDGYDSFEIEQHITVSKKDDGGHELIIAVMVKTDPMLSGTRVKYTYPLG